MRLQKYQQKETTNKNSIKTCDKTLLKQSSHNFALKKCSNEAFSNAIDILCPLSLMKIDNKKKKRERGKIN